MKNVYFLLEKRKNNSLRPIQTSINAPILFNRLFVERANTGEKKRRPGRPTKEETKIKEEQYAEIKTTFEPYAEGPDFSLYISSESETAPTVNLVGEVDLANAARIYSLMWRASRNGTLSLIINLKKLDFMDSSGLQVLLRLREKLKAKKKNVLLVAPKPQISKLLKLTGFDKLFALYDTIEEAELAVASDPDSNIQRQITRRVEPPLSAEYQELDRE